MKQQMSKWIRDMCKDGMYLVTSIVVEFKMGQKEVLLCLPFLMVLETHNLICTQLMGAIPNAHHVLTHQRYL